MAIRDAFGLTFSGATEAGFTPYSQAVRELLCFIGDPVASVDRAISADPGFVMAHVFKGYLFGLATERDDLVEAIKKLRTGIQSLNKEARERLMTSFDIVNGHFKRMFVELFGGGEAELKLIESDDPLEAGLEIVAKPPGKKPQTLSLLSGGEQALTALALIFAVFLTNPSPICVLDEVDAPLDDHNVERYCNLLHEMTSSTDTRFIIITHNPITMARMNRLFGVTMAERGVSQLVSVSLSEAVDILDQNVA